MGITLQVEKMSVAGVRSVEHNGEVLYVQDSHAGLVVSLREQNGYSDSDFYATVYNPEKNTFEEIMYATTRGWTYLNGAQVDATPEVQAKYKAHLEALAEADRKQREAAEAAIPRVGRQIEIVKGRKVPVGTKGKVFWFGKTQYGESVGFEKADGERLFTSAKNVKVIS